MRTSTRRPARWTIAIAIAVTGQTAEAQSVELEAQGALNVGYTQTTRPSLVTDPDAEPGDIPSPTTGGLFTEIRPGISLLSGSPRLTWRAAYMFSGNLPITGETLTSYSNQASAAVAAQVTKFSTLTFSGSVAQGGTSFLLSQRPAESGQPELRAPGNPALITATLVEAYSWEIGRHLNLQHSLLGSVSAPQDALDQRNSALTASVALERPYARDNYGIEARASVSWLRPLRMDLAPYQSYTNSLLARWNHDFTEGWNGLVTAGVEQVYTDSGSRPLAFLPTGTLSARYTYGDLVGGLELTHGTATNLQVGAVSITDLVTARGVIVLDPRKARVLSFSAGFLHNEPLGEISPLVSAGTGNAVQGDAAFATQIRPNVLATARYSLAYQYGQAGGIEPTRAHIFFVGVTASYKNTPGPTRPVPTRGRRVDGTDGIGFPIIEDAPPAP